MTYEETIQWLETADKRFPKGDQRAFAALMARLGDPQDKLRFIHVTGSNGKGSICAMLGSILQRSGYRTGLYTSPHLSVYNERCQLDGEMIPDETLARLAGQVKAAADALGFSFGLFYKMTAVAFLWFAASRCDIVVLEVGRGGRRDCTNIVKNTVLCVIGAISLEHTEVLGTTLRAICAEKCGIFKESAAAVMQHQSEEAMEEAVKQAALAGISLLITRPEETRNIVYDADRQTLDYRGRKDIRASCPGAYQTANVQTVLDAADLLRAKGFLIPEEALRSALAETVWPCRFERIRKEPLVLIDGAHNAGAVSALAAAIRTAYPGRRFTFVLTLLWDRPWKEMLRCVAPLAERFIAVNTADPKALRAEELADHIRGTFGIPAVAAEGEKEALKTALDAAGNNGCICVFGSLYLAGAVRDILLRQE